MKTITKLLAIVMILGMVFAFMPGSTVSANTLDVCPSGCTYTSIQAAINEASDGDTINVAAGTYVETGQLVINKNLTIVGADKATTIIKPAQNTGSSGDAQAWVLVQAEKTFNLSKVTLDGDSKLIRNAIRTKGSGSISDCVIQNIYYDKYNGWGVAMDYLITVQEWTITNNTFQNIQRVGILVDGQNNQATLSGNTFKGKGAGDWVNYGIEVGDGANATISENTFEDYLGVASSDGSTSAGILVTSYFGPKPLATITNNVFNNNTTGIALGYYDNDSSVVTAVNNTFTSNKYAISAENSTNINLAGALEYNTFDKAVSINDENYTIYSSIQEAIDAAIDGNEIEVGPGAYPEAITLNKPNITVKSTDGAATTIIAVPEGSLTTGVKVLANMGTVTFDGFTVQGFTEAGIIQGMAARTGTTFHVLNNVVIPRANYLRNGIQVTGDGSTVIGNFVQGAYLTEDWASTAIGVVNASNVLVEENEISGAVNGIDYGISVYTWNYDGTLVETSENVQVLSNILYNVDYPLDVTAYTGTIADITFKYNKVTSYVDPIWAGPYTQSGYDGVSVTNVDASPNWWGSIAGPGADQIEGDVVFTPWCGDEECTFTVPSAEGEIELPAGANAEDLQTAINNAPEGTTIIIPEGTYSQNGAFVIDTPHLTIQLSDGTVIQNNSPCFTIDASYTSIIAEPGAVCKPTNDSNGIDVADGLVNIVIEGLEIDGIEQVPSSGATPDGIHFNGAITDLVLRDNYIHDLDGDGISFAAAPAGVVDIHGNLFQNNTGNGIEAGSFPVPAEYNSWGSVNGAAAPSGDGISANVDAVPFTHVDLYMTSSVSPWLNQVVSGQSITYAVKAHMMNVNAADFVLKYDPTPLSVDSVIPGTDFVGIYTDDDPSTQAALVDYTSTSGEIRFTGFKLTGTVGGDVTLFTVTFKANANAAGTSALNFDEATDGFGMPGVGSSSNVYAAALVDGSVNVIDLPSMTSTDIQGPYIAGIPQDFHVTVVNPLTGGTFVNSIYYVFTIHDAELTDLKSLTCKFDGSTDTDILALMNDSTDDLVGRVGYAGVGFPMAPGFSTMTTCTVNFNEPGSYVFEVAMVDGASTPVDFVLASLSATALVNGNFTVTGTFSMQGRSFRGGIPVTLTWSGLPGYASSASTINQISNNLVATLKNGGTYTITTNQPRYLNVQVGGVGGLIEAKTVDISAAKTMSALELKGGNAIWTDNKINIQDAGKVGNEFGQTGNIDSDVNFDGKVNVQDLALVGGNFDLTSASAYGSWVP